ncbi:AAA family ATPase [Anabaena cylindrica UHCC 0172]|uniref:AAA family ATPase n=1 Tax=Anabaena cylindrica TaxID=1165 RepID=UPI002B1FF27C|nr:AAA family ATPase [Anabaena cylindrica]MEA5553438.1 AAA family ATPase [Anabaena cylindrica UHCC 0172]
MSSNTEYEILVKIYESDNSLVYKATIQPDHQPVILKILKDDYPDADELFRYKQEYEIIHSLNVQGVIKAYNLQRYKNSLVILLEDFGGQSLKLLMSKHQLSLEESLTIAIKITESLGDIHNANIIHKDINPANIVYNPETKQLKIIDFGISSRLSQENQTIFNINKLEGTLAYIAPEQSGRMNRGIDYRSDFYSLGVTLYEMLTYQLPFETNDPVELVHCHLAQNPKRPDELISSLPLTVSNIVIKLLAKTPEERYQSAWGIKADLESCLQQLKTLGQISQFPLASQDIIDKFYIPQKLYGREQEITQLLTTFERVTQGHTEMILVYGYSGIGKSALVNEIYKPITRERGYFISGKFDQLQRDIPYAAITQAFQNLIRQLLSEPETTLKTWKEKILEALGSNGQIIIDVIPELENIIGKQSSVEPLGSAEAQNRFKLFFQRFIGVFRKKEHPLVIFLDDLQWADLPSLNLIELLMKDTESQYLLIIGAYRDNEVSPTHPLMFTLEKINQVKTTITHIILKPLAINYVKQLLSETLRCTTEKSQPLAELITSKTNGNPFFLNQLLQSLYREKFLLFDNNKKCWYWEIDYIKKVGITDNVVDLMVKKIENLNHDTQNVLKLAACIGNQFNLDILSVVTGKSPTATAHILQIAIREGLILSLSAEYKIPMLSSQEEIYINNSEISDDFLLQVSNSIQYKFLHDRVQQAAYILIPEEEKQAVHLQVGRLMLKNIQVDELEKNIFEIVNQLNKGSKLITVQSEKDELAKLNLQAAKKAKASTAYEPALRYLESGLELLAVNSWESFYELTLEIHIEILEFLYLNSKFEQAEKLADFVLQNARITLDKVKVYELRIQSYRAQLQLELAIDTGLEILNLLGLVLPKQPSRQIILTKHLQIKYLLKKNEVEDLVNLPPMTDSYQLATINILSTIISPAFSTNPQLYYFVILSMNHICIEYGNSALASIAYVYYGSYLSGILGDVDSGYRFGQLSLQILDKFNVQGLRSIILHSFHSFIKHWKDDANKELESLVEAIQIGIEYGEIVYSSYASASYCYNLLFFTGKTLPYIEQEVNKYIDLFAKYNDKYGYELLDFCGKFCSNLIKTEANKIIVNTYIDNDDNEVNFYIENSAYVLVFFGIFFKYMYLYFLKDYASALEKSNLCEKYKNCGVGSQLTAQHNFYQSLTMLALAQNSDNNQREQFLKKVSLNQKQMKKWAENALVNYQNKYDLVAAEKARVLGQNWQAEELYEKAIQGAKKYEFIHEEALAYERAAEFYLQLGREEIGQLYLRNAHHCYTHWGAKAKVKQLEHEYPQYFIGTTNKGKAKSLSPTISTSGNDGTFLDLTTVIKASQVLAGEIVLGNLLAKLMKIVIENAGAQKGFLLLDSDDNWVIEAVGSIDSDDVNILQSIPVDSPDASTHDPLLSSAIINYVARTQENVVLNDAANEGQFTRDSYIIATLPKSILCTPLLNQRKLSGILYLENNLTTGAFTPERVEVLNILSSQAAISIENSRLYTTLEQKVEERTQELSQTLDILKATQAKLEFENALLKSDEEASSYNYQVGGSLPIDAPTYVVRSADRYLYKALRSGEFCYILNTRQMGKSSLMVRMMHYLQQEGFCCAAIDMTRIGSENITPDQWYKGLAVELWQGFDLFGKVNLKAWWQENIELSPVQRLSRFFEEVLLNEVKLSDGTPAPKIVIFLDEIDCILGLEFSVNDFFTLVRSCYNQRGINPEYKRLCFVLLGVATPSDLITDYRRTPFNIGQAIQLQGFQLHEAQPLLHGFSDKVSNPQAVLREVLFWTNGQPFLTQKICQMVRNSSSSISEKSEKAWVENLIRTSIIDDWEAQDEPEHLRTIRDRILKGEQPATSMLELYRQVLEHGKVKAADSPIERELILSGLLVKEESYLKIHNRIYEVVFDNSWILQNI